MANAFNVNGNINQFDIAGSIQQGLRFGQQQRDLRESREREQKVRSLAPQVIAGDPNAYSQAAAIDPEATAAYQSAGDSQLRRLQGAVNYFDNARKSKNPQAVQAAFNQVVPFLSKITGRPPPPGGYDEATMGPAFEQLRAMTAMLPPTAGQQRNVALSPGSALLNSQTGEVLYERPYAPANASIIEVPDGNGGKVQMLFDPRTRQLSEPQYPGRGETTAPPESAPPTFMGPDGIPVDVSGVTDPNVRASIAANPEAYAEVPSGSSANLPDHIVGGGRLGYTPPKDDGKFQSRQYTPAEVAQIGLPPGTVAYTTESGKPDVVSRPDARTGSGGEQPLSAGERAKVRGEMKDIKDALGMFKAFDSALESIGKYDSVTDGASKGRLGTAYNNARSALRVLYNTGVLQPGELPMLNQALQDPNAMMAILDPRSRPQIQAQLDELYRTIERQITNKVRSYPQLWDNDAYERMRGGSSGASPATSSSATGADPLGIL